MAETHSPLQKMEENREGCNDKNCCGSCRRDESSAFACNVCLAEAWRPVVTQCGHLYCWHCLWKWAQVHTCRDAWCPVCNARLDLKSVTPVYTRDCTDHQDSREDAQPPWVEQAVSDKPPPRPRARRPPTVSMDAPVDDHLIGLTHGIYMREIGGGFEAGAEDEARLAAQRTLLVVGCVLISLVLVFL